MALLSWIKSFFTETAKQNISDAIKADLANGNNFEIVLNQIFESLEKNGFFKQKQDAWRNQIIKSVKNNLPGLDERPKKDDLALADRSSRKRRNLISEEDLVENVRRSKRVRKPNKRYLDV